MTVGGATTGFGADIIIDDAMKAGEIVSEARRQELELFYSATLVSRLASQQQGAGVIISIQQRLGEEDLPARLINAGAEHINLPAYDDKETVYDIGFGRIYRRPVGEVLRPDDEHREELDRIRRDMGPHAFATQYLGQPHALEGNVIRTEAFARYDPDDFVRSDFPVMLQSWDLATSIQAGADFSACITAGYHGGKWYIRHVLRERMEFPVLRDRILAHARLHSADKVVLDDAGAGQHLWQELNQKGSLRPYKIRPEHDKVTRMVRQLGMIEDGEVLLPDHAPSLDILLGEMRAFPSGTYDDQVDAFSQLLQGIRNHPNFAPTNYDPKTGRRLTTRRRPGPRRR